VEVEHNAEAKWLQELREEKGEYHQDNIIINEKLVSDQCRKLLNWKAAGPNGVQGCWLKRFRTLHGRIASQMNTMINGNDEISVWLTTGRTVLCQKDKKG